jgi:hypothetical protein
MQNICLMEIIWAKGSATVADAVEVHTSVVAMMGRTWRKISFKLDYFSPAVWWISKRLSRWSAKSPVMIMSYSLAPVQGLAGWPNAMSGCLPREFPAV